MRHGDQAKPRFGRHVKDTWVPENRRTKHGVGILMNKKWRKQNQLDRLHQQTRHCNIDHSQQAACTDDECVLLPLGICRTSCRESVQNNRETHEIQEEHSNHWWRLQRWIGAWHRCRALQCRTTYPQRGKQERWLDEAVADDTELRCTQHNVQKDARKTNFVQNTERCREN